MSRRSAAHRPARHRAAGLRPVVALVALVAAGCTAAPGSGTATSSGPPGPTAPAASTDLAGPVDLGGGRTVYLECHGSGGPTVVLLSGYGNAADIWQEADAYPPSVASGVASFARVCAYDRPGSYVTTLAQDGARVPATSPDQYRPARGTAVASTMPGSGAPVVADLHHLLEVAGVSPPYVLVGHSLGGLFAQLYARTYPGEVTGMVLVDPPTPNLKEFLAPATWAAAWQSQLDPGPSVVPAYVNERYRVDAIFDEINAAVPLPPIPVTYLAATVKPALDQLPPTDQARALETITQLPVAAAAYVHSLPGGRFVAVPDTTHYLQTERPDVVIAAVRAAVAGTTLATTPAPPGTRP